MEDRAEANKENDDGEITVEKALEKSLEALGNVDKILSCVRCKKAPVSGEKIMMLGTCVHKYCEDCIEMDKAQTCEICKATNRPGKAVEDTFSTELVLAYTELKDHLMMVRQMSPQDELMETLSDRSDTDSSDEELLGKIRGRPESPSPPKDESMRKISRGSESPASTSFLSTSRSSSGKVDKKNAKGETLLHVACRTGQLEKAQQLLEDGADTNVQDFANWTPLHEAINGKANKKTKLELVKLLIEKGDCNPNIPGMDNETALHEASRGNLQDIIVYLLAHGASPNIRNRIGQFPRDVAATKEIEQIYHDSAEAISSTSTSPDSSLLMDPAVLEIQLASALLNFQYNISQEEILKVEQVLKLKVSRELSSAVTHIIFRLKTETGEIMKVPLCYEWMYGISMGAWMLNFEWIEKSLAGKVVLSPCEFELSGCDDLPDVPDTSRISSRCARLNKELGNPGLFHGFCFYFYKNPSFESYGKKDLISLIRLNGGEIINREPQPNVVDPLDLPVRFHVKQDNHKLVLTSHIILYDERNKPPIAKMYNLEHVKTLQTKWLADSLCLFQIQDSDNYL